MNNPSFKIRRLSEIERDESICILLWGGAGTGKTYFCGTAGSRTLFINIGVGIATLKSPDFTKRYQADPVVVDIDEKLDEYLLKNPEVLSKNDVSWAFDLVTDAVDLAIDGEYKDEVDTIVVDDATALRRIAMNKGIMWSEQWRKSETRKNFVKSDLLMPDITDYPFEMDLVEQFVAGTIKKCKAAGKHLIITAHEREIYGKPARIGDPPPLLKVRPGFTGKTFPDEVVQYFDLTWRTQAVGGGSNVVYRIRTVGDENMVAKSRWGGIFNVEEKDLSFPEVVRRIREGIPAEKKTFQTKR
jgi:hypothetical protein